MKTIKVAVVRLQKYKKKLRGPFEIHKYSCCYILGKNMLNFEALLISQVEIEELSDD